MRSPPLHVLLSLALLVAHGAAVAETYRWVDSKGVVHYSDRPQPGAEKVDLPSAQTYQAPARPAPAASTPLRSDAAATQEAPVRCAIVSPRPDEVFVNVPSVTIGASGPLDAAARLELNGSPWTPPQGGSPMTVSPIARGTYSAVVVYRGSAGRDVCRTPAVTFHVRQPSVLSPASPLNPMNRPPGR